MMKYTISLFATLMLAACTSEPEPTHTPQTASPVAQSVSTTKPASAASTQPETLSASSDCQKPQPAQNFDDVMQQILANIDNTCLFDYGNELNNIWFTQQSRPLPTLERTMFPELDPNAPDYAQRLQEETDKVMKGERKIDPALINQLAQQVQNTNQVLESKVGKLRLYTGKSVTDGTRQTRQLTFRMKDGSDFSGSFANIHSIPDNFKQRGKIVLPYQPTLFRLFNSERNPDKPYLEIEFDEQSGKITQITFNENVANVSSNIHNM